MGARSGRDYLDALRGLHADVWLDGARVGDPTTHPALARCARSVAALYDMQAADPEAMTYPTRDGERAGLSFVQARSSADVRARSAMMKRWADFSGGMLGRTPDFMNVMFAGYAAAHEYFAQGGAQFGDNIRRYHDRLRRADLCLTHTLVHPQRDRATAAPVATEELRARQ